jgi:sulfate transport system permease protein
MAHSRSLSPKGGRHDAGTRVRRAQQDPLLVRVLLIAAAALSIGVLVIVPTVFVFVQALRPGLSAYVANLVRDRDTWSAITLTLTVAPSAVLLNIVFGVAAAWLIARFRFPGRTLLTTLIDVPFSVSPVVAGLMFVLIFGLQGYLGPWLRADGLRAMLYVVSFAGALVAFGCGARLLRRRVPGRAARLGLAMALGVAAFAALATIQNALGLWPHGRSLNIIFATPGLILATTFVTFPFVARELIPVMEAFGEDEDLAAISLGASAWQMFWRVTLPNIKWGLLYGVILCNARAMGEFGAVYVVSGRIAGKTDTMPLRVEKLYQEYNLPGAYAVASLLTLLALVTLVVKAVIERRIAQRVTSGAGAELALAGPPGKGMSSHGH